MKYRVTRPAATRILYLSKGNLSMFITTSLSNGERRDEVALQLDEWYFE